MKPLMQFLLDQNVPESVVRFLRQRGHKVHLVRDVLLPDAPDPVIATISEENGWILVSADRDFDRITRRIPIGSKARFRKLSRISLQCSEYQAAARLEKYIDYVEMAYQNSRGAGHSLRIVIQNAGFKISD